MLVKNTFIKVIITTKQLEFIILVWHQICSYMNMVFTNITCETIFCIQYNNYNT